MLLVIGIFLAAFLALLILTKKGRSLADIILGVWMMIISLHLALYYGFITESIFKYPFLLGLNAPIPFFHGVFLYLYVAALTEPHSFKSKKWLLHFILPAGIISLYFPFIISPAAEKLKVYENDGRGYETIMDISGVLLNISGVLYILITNRLLQEHKKRMLNQFSNQEKINLNWLRFLTYAMIGMWILIIFIKNDTAIFSAASVFVVFIGYFGIKQVGIFANKNIQVIEYSPVKEDDIKIEESPAEKKKYAKSGLNEEMTKDLYNRLNDVMQKEKLFTEPELTLADLASRLKTHPNYLSQVINKNEGKSFCDYVNGLRIEEFKRLAMIPKNQQYTLLTLAYDCGFNSKSAFNRYFKKTTGMSPSVYINQALSTSKNMEDSTLK